MSSFTRIAGLLMVLGVTLIILSYASPMVQPSYTPIFNLSYGNYEGIMAHCYGDIDIQIESRNNKVFSAFFMDSINGLLAVKEGSLENVTLLNSFMNRTILYAHLSVPAPGWYSILVTPSDDETIQFMTVQFTRQIPNLRALLGGGLLFVFSMPWILELVRIRISEKRRQVYNKATS
jgi:hypothetical protein